MPFHPAAPPMPAKPMQPPSPLMKVFHGISAHQMAPPLGHPLAPMQAPGAPMPLGNGGHPAAKTGHMQPMMK